jgi:hypothetical protein
MALSFCLLPFAFCLLPFAYGATYAVLTVV